MSVEIACAAFSAIIATVSHHNKTTNPSLSLSLSQSLTPFQSLTKAPLALSEQASSSLQAMQSSLRASERSNSDRALSQRDEEKELEKATREERLQKGVVHQQKRMNRTNALHVIDNFLLCVSPHSACTSIACEGSVVLGTILL